MNLETLSRNASEALARQEKCLHEWNRDYYSRIERDTGSEVCIHCGMRRAWEVGHAGPVTVTASWVEPETPSRPPEMPQDRSEGV